MIAKSIVIFDVKVYEEEENLDNLAQKIFNEVNMDGLVWSKDYKLIPIAYGMKKLRLTCVVEDDKVGTDDIFDKILAWEDIVQSVDVDAMQKVWEGILMQGGHWRHSMQLCGCCFSSLYSVNRI